MKKTIIIISALLMCATACAQGGNLGNNSGALGDFLGWDGTGLAQPLNIRNDFNQNINILRNGLNRMQFQTENWTGLNGAF